MLASLDIETACGQIECPNYGHACDHALDPRRNQITVIGIWTPEEKYTFRNLDKFLRWNSEYKPNYTGFNLKFDLSVLNAKGANIPLERWTHDAFLMANVLTEKISPSWLEGYEAERKRLNEGLPKGKGHREAGQHSLKTLAPYFLDVPAFWEATTDHDNDEYVLKDAEYAWLLTNTFIYALEAEGSYEFYEQKLLPWVKLLYSMENRGISIDVPLIKTLAEEADVNAAVRKDELDKLWQEAYEAYKKKDELALAGNYALMEERAWNKLPLEKKTPEKLALVKEKYFKLYQKAYGTLENKINLDSPAQMKWLLQDYFQLDITDFHDEESTGKPVLKRLAAQGRTDIEKFLDYRMNQKLATAFFPSYLDMQHDGVIHCSFNPGGTRTGRLSSSKPNLQQVPGHIHKVFTARQGYQLISRDASAIEARLIAYATEDTALHALLSSGVDFHGFNAVAMFNLDCAPDEVKLRYPKHREVAKEVTFALFYGAAHRRIQESAQKRGFNWSTDFCKEAVRAFRARYWEAYQYKGGLDEALRNGEIVKNMFGRPFRIPDPEDVHMKGFNTLIQGSASDLVLHSAYRIQQECDAEQYDAHVLLLVHDEVVVECPTEYIEDVAEIMDRIMTDYSLQTRNGAIELKVEGKSGFRWEK